MSQMIELRVPDIGDYKDVPVIELLVAVGDTIAVDTALVTLESDKATMDVPSTAAGRIAEILVKTGDRVSEASVIARLEISDAAA
ncbi:MAG TPA: dihydrolipoamide acetyltransferase, partial [Accumulibacter sp.]|nr:dihydrolipoamide acetyltransferase [Accumulibacter sp.]